jgi:hypothetical protein
MGSFLHKGHSIICDAALDNSTGKYAPTGQFVWYTAKGKFGTYSFTLSKLFDTRDEAKAVAASEAIARVDQRLRASGSYSCDYPIVR